MKRQDYVIYPKKNKKGEITFYYTIYDTDGIRHSYSTGTKDRIEAEKITMSRLRNGTLIPNSKIQFSEYAKDFYNPEKSLYLKAKSARGFIISKSNATKNNNFINKSVIPFFKNKRIDTISVLDIETFLQKEKEKGKANSTINNEIKIIRNIFNQAFREHLIKWNPFDSIVPFRNDTKEKGSFSAKEVNFMFSKSNIKKIWNENLETYLFNKLAVKTGLRIGELQALRIEDLSNNALLVRHSWTEGEGLVETKTRTSRIIPISSDLEIDLANYLGSRKTGFIFSHTDGKTPITRHQIYKTYKNSLANAGFSQEILKARNLSFHSWRHTFASILANVGAPELFIRKLTGHKSATVFQNYTHADIEEMRKYMY